MKFSRRGTHQRFVDEIHIHNSLSDISELLPAIASHVPSEYSDDNPAWFAMPKAETLPSVLPRDATFETIVKVVRDIASVLVKLHDRNIPHRDIKPNNIFYWKGRWTLGDFGIAKRPDKSGKTLPNQKLGPLYYIAPEMLNAANDADGRPADLYSLAKVFWKLASGSEYPLPGHHRSAEPALTVSYYTTDARAVFLDGLISRCTDFDPRNRPTAKQFLREVERWLRPEERRMRDMVLPDMRDVVQFLADRQQDETARQQDLASEITQLGEAMRKQQQALMKDVSEATGLMCSIEFGGLNPLQRHPIASTIADWSKQVSRQSASFTVRTLEPRQFRIAGEVCISQVENQLYCALMIVLAEGPLQQPHIHQSIAHRSWTFDAGSTEVEAMLSECDLVLRSSLQKGIPLMRDILLQTCGKPSSL